MIKVRRADDRGQANHGWLQSAHTFSFADYYDPEHMGFSALRVINEDWIAGSAGFPTHGHRDMEIVTYVIEGALEHKDSMGNSTRILPGEVQRMSAGTGVRHSEYNPLPNQQTHLLQIWILPDRANYPASYEQKQIQFSTNSQDLVLIASQDGRDGSVSLHQDVDIFVGKSSTSQEKIINLDENRFYWIQVVKGLVQANEYSLASGDAVAIHLLKRVHLKWQAGAEFLFFDLP